MLPREESVATAQSAGRFADVVTSGTHTFVFVGNDVGVVLTGERVKGSD